LKITDIYDSKTNKVIGNLSETELNSLSYILSKRDVSSKEVERISKLLNLTIKMKNP
jgi:hypothetical protein